MATAKFQLRNVRGSSLLDGLSAVVVLSIGLLGLAGLQGRVQNMAAAAENGTIALELAQSRLERLRGIASEPGRAGAGYARIGNSRETVAAIGDRHLDTPISLQVDVARFRLEAGAESHYIAAAADAPFQVDLPEFKRVTVTATWTGKTGVPHTVTLPGIISPAAF